MDEFSKAKRFIHLMVGFWVGVTCLTLIICTAGALINHPAWLHDARLLWLVGGIALFSGWYGFAQRWLMRGERSWQPDKVWWRFAYWLGIFLTAWPLIALDPVYFTLMWIALGAGISIGRMPWSVFTTAIPALIIVYSWGLWPNGNDPGTWLVFIGTLMGVSAYCAVAYLPGVLLRQRFHRERVFKDLEQAHADLAAAHIQLAHSAAQDREIAVLRERERLSRDMHDTLGHALALTTIKLEAIRRLYPVDPDRAEAEIEQTQSVVRDAMRELRATLAALRCPSLAREPLAEALRDQASQTAARACFTLTYDSVAVTETWPEAAQAALLRIGLEALNNIEQHAHASHVRIMLISENNDAVLHITDDGVGLPDLPRGADGVISPAGHLGLTSMRERAQELGGRIAIQSLPAGGVAITARLPLPVPALTALAAE